MNSRHDDESGSTEHTNRRHPNIDPAPSGDPDLEQGGSVRPGATPPESNSATSSPPHPPASHPPRTNWKIIGLGILIAVVVLVFVAYAVGLFD